MAANDAWLPAWSRIPLELAANATLKLPTEVSAVAGELSAIVKVATVPLVLTLWSVPLLGTLVSDQGDVAVEVWIVSLKVAWT